jgi:hypothetical protein
MLWEFIAATLTAVGSIVGAGFTVKWIIKHEQQQCDARLDAFREGLDRGTESHD